jgi:ABC-type transport system involved in multi-copper enzyme maturation permease subunit
VIDGRKLGIVARFELAEALRSRLVIVVVCLYGAGAALGSFLFIQALNAAERGVRASLDAALVSHAQPDADVQRDAVRQILSAWVSDRDLLADLLSADPLALFYGFVSLQLVGVFVLLTSAGTHSADRSRGTTRYVLTRCDRLSWSLGKLLAHALLLAVGLTVSALATAAVGLWQGRFDVWSVLWLSRAALRALMYGLAYLGIFSGISLAIRAPAPARVASAVALVGLWFGHALSDWGWLARQIPGLHAAVWLFPAEYQERLWSPSWLVSGAAALALLGIGGLAFAVGQRSFSGADA